MPDNLRRPIERSYEDIGPVAVVVDDIGDSVVTTFVGDDASVPQVARGQFIKYDDITRLPPLVAGAIVGDKLIRENGRFAIQEYLQVLDTPIVDIAVSCIRVERRILQDISMDKRTEIDSRT